MDFGNKVQILRKNHNISQENLAIILKINRNHLSRIETGKSEPTLSIIRDIANYFNVDVASLMDMDNRRMNTKDKINAIDEGCHHLIDDDLDTLLRLISVMREEYVKKEK
ncbi:MAG: helix-turn-helix transcriptional regulator [Bacilli bacterium]|nr:helix-turn-helix transcriptional regulator [Bacilli bacterium]